MMRPNLILIMKHTYAIKSLVIIMFRFFCFSIFFLVFFFGILLVFASFHQAYYDIYFFVIPFFYFYLLQISFYIYLLLALLIFLYHFLSNLLLYLVLFLCFFDNKLKYSLLYITKKNFIKIIKYLF